MEWWNLVCHFIICNYVFRCFSCFFCCEWFVVRKILAISWGENFFGKRWWIRSIRVFYCVFSFYLQCKKFSAFILNASVTSDFSVKTFLKFTLFEVEKHWFNKKTVNNEQKVCSSGLLKNSLVNFWFQVSTLYQEYFYASQIR